MSLDFGTLYKKHLLGGTVKYAIIGAGITGSLLSQKLLSCGHQVEVFEKSRGRGGRSCYKRVQWGAFDIGATVVPASDEAFVGFMQQQAKQGTVKHWPDQVFEFNTNLSERHDDRHYFVFSEGMNGGCRTWLEGATLKTHVRIEHLQKTDKGWLLWDQVECKHGPFDYVVSTVPWPQNSTLLSPWTDEKVLNGASREWTSCWAFAIEFSETIPTCAQLIYVKNSPIQQLINQSAKPGSDDESQIWVAQFSNRYSDLHSQDNPKTLLNIALSEMEKVLGPLPEVKHSYSHFWRYARPVPGQSQPGIIKASEKGLVAGGDWSFSGSVQGAFKAANQLFEEVTR